MDARLRLIRTLLFVPGDDERKLGRALGSDADAVVIDLEDAVGEPSKAVARERAAAALEGAGPGPMRFVRINGAGSPHLEDDLAWLRRLTLDGVVVPKAAPAAIEQLSGLGLPLIAIVETASGVRLAWELARCDRVAALMLGAVDLGAELRLDTRPDGLELHYARSKLVVDSAAAGLRAPFDGVHLRIDDDEGLRAAAELARSLGFGGKACIHPGQLPVVRAVFSPSREQLARAQRVVDAAEAAASAGRGAVALDGEMVDAAVVTQARRLIGESEGHER